MKSRLFGMSFLVFLALAEAMPRQYFVHGDDVVSHRRNIRTPQGHASEVADLLASTSKPKNKSAKKANNVAGMYELFCSLFFSQSEF